MLLFRDDSQESGAWRENVVISTEERRLWRQAGLDSGHGTTAWLRVFQQVTRPLRAGCGLTDCNIGIGTMAQRKGAMVKIDGGLF